MQNMYSRENLLSLRQVRANFDAGALDLCCEFPDLQPTRKRGRRGVSHLKIGRPANAVLTNVMLMTDLNVRFDQFEHPTVITTYWVR